MIKVGTTIRGEPIFYDLCGNIFFGEDKRFRRPVYALLNLFTDELVNLNQNGKRVISLLELIASDIVKPENLIATDVAGTPFYYDVVRDVVVEVDKFGFFIYEAKSFLPSLLLQQVWDGGCMFTDYGKLIIGHYLLNGGIDASLLRSQTDA